MRDGAARPRARARVGRAHGDPRAGRTALDLRRARRHREPDRARAGRGLGLVPGNRVLLARAEQPDARGVLVRRHEGRRHRGRVDAAAARARADRHRHQGRDHARAVRRPARRRARGRAAAVPDADVDCAVRHVGGERHRCAPGGQVLVVHRCRYGRRRRRADRIHVGHDRQAQGHDAFPPRRDRGLRLLPALDAAGGARRCLHREPAARVHVRPGRPAAVSAADRRLDAAHRENAAGRAAAGDHRASRHRAVHGADVVPRDGARGGAARSRVAAQMRIGRRGAAGGDAQAVEGRDAASRSSTASGPPSSCTSSSRTTRRTRGRAPPASRFRDTARA